MDADLFEKWVDLILEPIVERANGRKPVLILDNARYHCRALFKPPTSSSRKQEMLEFMETNDLEIPDPIPNKPQLYAHLKQQLKKHPTGFKRLVIHEKCEEHGVLVLFLPPYHCSLNPIELCWSNFKHHLR